MTTPAADAAKYALAIPLVLMVGGSIARGSIFSANQIAAQAGFPLIAYAFWQILLAAAAMIVVSMALRSLPPLGRAHIRQYALTAVISVSIPTVALTLVAGKLPVGVITLVQTLSPALTYLFAFGLRIERFQALSIAALFLGLGGILMIVLPEGSLGTGFQATWLIVALGAPLGYALNNVAVALLRPPATSSLQLATGAMIVGAVVLLPAMLIFDGPVLLSDMAGEVIFATVWAAAVNIVTFLFLFELIRLAGPVFFSYSSYLRTVAGYLFGLIIFPKEAALGPWVWAAVVLMAAGLVLANMAASRSARERRRMAANAWVRCGGLPSPPRGGVLARPEERSLALRGPKAAIKLDGNRSANGLIRPVCGEKTRNTPRKS